MKLKLFLILLASCFLMACRASNLAESPLTPTVSDEVNDDAPQEPAGLPNPASLNCEEKGYVLEMREGEAGMYGVCQFPDGSECDEWAYFRGECQPGDSLIAPTSMPVATNTATPESESWRLYTNVLPAYTFLYPPDAVVESNEDPRQSVAIVGPLVADENWPMIYVSHPQDRAEFKPPADVDLAHWLAEQMLWSAGSDTTPVERQQAERKIAGETAVHTRFERSPQSYAFDKYFFVHEGQLYSIVILHTGDREDWDLYDKFLDSFQFLSQNAQEDAFYAPAACQPTFAGTYLLYDGDLGICFLYPDDFEVFQGEDGSLTLYRTSLLNTAAPLATIQVEAADSRSLADVTAQRLADFAFPDTQAADAELGEERAALLDNLPGQDLNRRLVALHQDRVFDLIVSRIGEEYGAVGDEAAALFDLISSSWRFVDRNQQVGLRAGPECPGQQTGTVLLRNEADGYCLLLPENYSVDTGLTSTDGRSETAVYRDSPLDGDHARLFITVEDTRGKTLEGITEDYKDETEAAIPGFDLMWTAGLMLDGAWVNEFAQVPGQDLARVLLLVQDGRLYTLTFIPDDDEAGQAYVDMEALYKLVTESFSFLWTINNASAPALAPCPQPANRVSLRVRTSNTAG